MGLFQKIKSLFQKPLQIKNFTGQEVVIRSKNSGKIDLNRKLIVPENFICFLVAKETVCDKFTSGDHKLSIDNLPVLTRKLKLNVPNKKGKYKDKFFADIYFVNLAQINDCIFSSEQGIYIKKDKEFLGLTCFVKGKYQFKIADPHLFLEAILKVYGVINSGLAKRQIGIWTGELVDKKIEKNKPTVEQINERDSSCFEGLVEYLNKNTKDIGIEYTSVEITETVMPKKIYRKTKLEYSEQTETTQKTLEPKLEQQSENIPNLANDNGKAPTIMQKTQTVITDGINFFEDIKDFNSSTENINIENIGAQTFEQNSTNQANEYEQDSVSNGEYLSQAQTMQSEQEGGIITSPFEIDDFEAENQSQDNSHEETLEEMQVRIKYKQCKHCGAINSKDSKRCFNCKQEFKKICQKCEFITLVGF